MSPDDSPVTAASTAPDRSTEALFVDDGRPRLVEGAVLRVRATPFVRGPWDLSTLHGGPVGALLAEATEREVRCLSRDDGPEALPWLCSRLTVDILSPVPLGEIEATVSIVKRGRRAMVIDAGLWVPGRSPAEPRLAARSSSQWIVEMPSAATGDTPTPPPPRTGTLDDPTADERFDYPRPGFNCDTCDLEYVVGSHEDPGPGTSWIRFRVPVVDGVELTPFTRIAAVADLAAAAGWDNTPDGGNYINPDLTLQLNRWPDGEWLAVAARTHHGTGSALLESRWFDSDGLVGTLTQSLVVAPRTLD